MYLLLTAAALGLLTLSVAAACGNKGGGVQIVEQPNGAAPGQDGGGGSALLDCLRQHGFAVPSGGAFRRPSGSFSPRPRPTGSFFPRPRRSINGSFRGGFPSIPAACASLIPSGRPGGFRGPGNRAPGGGAPATTPSPAG